MVPEREYQVREQISGPEMLQGVDRKQLVEMFRNSATPWQNVITDLQEQVYPEMCGKKIAMVENFAVPVLAKYNLELKAETDRKTQDPDNSGYYWTVAEAEAAGRVSRYLKETYANLPDEEKARIRKTGVRGILELAASKSSIIEEEVLPLAEIENGSVPEPAATLKPEVQEVTAVKKKSPELIGRGIRAVSVGMLAVGTWLSAQPFAQMFIPRAEAAEQGRTRIERAEKADNAQISAAGIRVDVPESLTVTNQAAELNDHQSENSAGKEVKPGDFAAGAVSLRQEFQVSIGGNMSFTTTPLVNTRESGFDENLLQRFQDPNNPARWSECLVTKTDLPGVPMLICHSGNRGVQPWDAAVNADRGVTATLSNPDGARESYMVTEAFNVSTQLLNPNVSPGTYGKQEGGMIARTDIMGISDEARLAVAGGNGFILVVCDGSFIREGTEAGNYTEKRIEVWQNIEPSVEQDSPYVSEVKQLTEAINHYPQENPYGQESVRLGDYLKSNSWYSEWYSGKKATLSAEQMANLDRTLEMLNISTYRYVDPKTGLRQVLQCLEFVRLLSALGYSESPTNVAAASITWPGELIPGAARNLGGRWESVQASGYGFPMLVGNIPPARIGVGDVFMTETHAGVVIDIKSTTHGTVFVVAQSNVENTGLPVTEEISEVNMWKAMGWGWGGAIVPDTQK